MLWQSISGEVPENISADSPLVFLIRIIGRVPAEMHVSDSFGVSVFFGRRCDRIKALLWEGDGFLLMYKRLDNGAFRWPRSADEAMAITDDQYRMLMQGLEIVARHPISELKETPRIM